MKDSTIGDVGVEEGDALRLGQRLEVEDGGVGDLEVESGFRLEDETPEVDSYN